MDSRLAEVVLHLHRTKTLISYIFPTRVFEAVGYWESLSRVANNLYLSRLPNHGEEEMIKSAILENKDAPLKLVVSTVEKRENSESLPFKWCPIIDPTSGKEWKENYGVEQRQFEMQDFNDGLEVDFVAAAHEVIAIQKYRESDQTVLVHCKAGRTRSATMVACVLAVYDFGQKKENADKTPAQLIEMALLHLAECRAQVKVNATGKKVAEKIVLAVRQLLQKNADQLQGSVFIDSSEAKLALPQKMAFIAKLNTLLGNPSGIAKLPAYAKLSAYRDKLQAESYFGSKRALSIDTLFAKIAKADTMDWFIDLMLGIGPAKELLDATPYRGVMYSDSYRVSDKAERVVLIEEFKNAMCDLLGCERSIVEVAVKSYHVDKTGLSFS